VGDWTQELPVLAAIRDFDAAQVSWRKVGPASGILPSGADLRQRTAFARMRSADDAYVLARDAAIRRVRLKLTYHEEYFNRSSETKVNLAKERRRGSDGVSPA
jgi:hypothetical protein